MALALSLGIVAACVPPEEPPTAGTHLGAWVASEPGACEESLTFSADGRYRFRLAMQVDGAASMRQMAGVASDIRRLSDGSLAATLAPDAPWADALPGDCAGWRRSTRVDLGFESLAVTTGEDLAVLRYRSVPLSGGRWAWVGADSLREQDRFALVLDQGMLRGFPLTTLPVGGPPLFHRVPRELPSRLFPGNPVPLVNLPQQAWQAWIPSAPVGASLGKLLLSVHSATDVTFSVRPVGAVYPLCDLVVWDSYDYQRLVLPNPLAEAVDGTVLTLNPLDPAAPLVTEIRTVDGNTEFVYLLPLEIRAPAPTGACELNIRGRPAAGTRVQSHLAGAAPEDDPLHVPLPDAPAFLLAGSRPSTPGITALPLNGFAAVGEVALMGALILPAAANPPILNAPDGAPRPLRLSVTATQGRDQLSVYAAMDGAAGIGPFLRSAGNLPSAILAPGVPHVVSQGPGDPPARLRIPLTAPAILSLYSSGGVSTSARLLAADESPLAMAGGGAADGAPDNAGFRIVTALDPGEFVLEVRGTSLPAEFTVHWTLLESQGPLDLALEACLRSAIPEAAPAASLRVADCTGHSLRSLAGISVYTGLQHLRLDGSRALDLAPLTALPRLGGLSLAHTRITDLTALAGLGTLHTLSLAGGAVDADGLAVLGSLGGHLTWLDLREAQGITDEALETLAAALPNALIVAPDGSIRP